MGWSFLCVDGELGVLCQHMHVVEFLRLQTVVNCAVFLIFLLQLCFVPDSLVFQDPAKKPLVSF